MIEKPKNAVPLIARLSHRYTEGRRRDERSGEGATLTQKSPCISVIAEGTRTDWHSAARAGRSQIADLQAFPALAPAGIEASELDRGLGLLARSETTRVGNPSSSIPCWTATPPELMQAINEAPDRVHHELWSIPVDHVPAAARDHQFGPRRQAHPFG